MSHAKAGLVCRRPAVQRHGAPERDLRRMEASRFQTFAASRSATRSRGARPPAADTIATFAASVILAVIAALSVATFNDGVVPAGAGALQQFAVLGLWVLVIAITFAIRPVLAPAFGTDFWAIVGFYVFAALSVLWSDHSSATVLKGIALSITTVAAYRVSTRLPLETILEAVSAGFVLVSAGSVALVLLVPSVGVDQTWMHRGQWQGVFQSKQSLGTVGAFLMFFAFHRLLNHGGWLRFLLVFGLAATCVVGAGSRGGAAVALAACLSLSLPRRWSGIGIAMAFGPVLMTGVALVAIASLIASGDPFLPLFGQEVDFTERGMIWQYALSHFADRPLLGFGLNGFWSADGMLHGFERQHGWVLDNYHDGYIGILIETGIVGMAIFVAGMLLFGVKMGRLIARRGMPQADATVIVGFVNLVFFIDFTETFFLRSTNINSILLIIVLLVSCRVPGRPEPSA